MTSRKSLEVCLVSPLPPPYGGIARWTTMIMRHAEESAGDIALRVVDTAVRLRSPAASTPARVVSGSVEAARIVLSVAARLVAHRPDVLHLNTSGSLGANRDLAIVALARLFRVPVAYHLRFGRVPDIASRDTREWRLIVRVARLARTVICIDEATASTLRQHVPDIPAVLVPNCVDLSGLPSSREARRPEVVFVGWHVPTKGVEELLTAWQRLSPPGWTLSMVGPAPPGVLERLRHLAGDARVDFHGEQPHDEVLERMARSAVLVLPSHTEGFPNVVVEAMALGTPVIATAVGAIPEMLADDAGILVPVANVDELAAALMAAIQDPDSLREMARRAADRARTKYSLEAVFARYCELWRSAVTGD